MPFAGPVKRTGIRRDVNATDTSALLLVYETSLPVHGG
jgi:hypothetical protein